MWQLRHIGENVPPYEMEMVELNYTHKVEFYDWQFVSTCAIYRMELSNEITDL